MLWIKAMFRMLIIFLWHLPMFGIKPEHTALNTESHNAMWSIWPSISSVRNELETLSMTHYFISIQTVETFNMHYKEYLHFYTVLLCSMQYACILFRRLSKCVIMLNFKYAKWFQNWNYTCDVMRLCSILLHCWILHTILLTTLKNSIQYMLCIL